MGGRGSGRNSRGSGKDKPAKDMAAYMRARRAEATAAKKAAADAHTRSSHLPVLDFFRTAAASSNAANAGSSTSSGVVSATGAPSGDNRTNEDIHEFNATAAALEQLHFQAARRNSLRDQRRSSSSVHARTATELRAEMKVDIVPSSSMQISAVMADARVLKVGSDSKHPDTGLVAEVPSKCRRQPARFWPRKKQKNTQNPS